MRDAARDSYLLLLATAQTKWVRWQATINLMELASLDQVPEAFDSYASELRKAPLGPWLRAHFLLLWGEGLERFSRFEAAEQVLAEAIEYSEANQIFAVNFKAEASLAAVRSRTKQQTAPVPTFAQVPHEVLAAAHAISELRKAATASA